MTRSFLIGLVFMGFFASGSGVAKAAASQAYLDCLQRAADHCKAETAHVKKPHRSKAYKECYDRVRPRCSAYTGPNRALSTTPPLSKTPLR